MAFSRSRTRSCAVRRRFRIARQLGRGGVEQLAADRRCCAPMRSASSGAASSSSRRPARCGSRQLRSRASNRPVASRVSADLDQLGRREPPAASWRARARRGCRARRRCRPAPGRRAVARPHRSGPGAGSTCDSSATGRSARASSRAGSKLVCVASCSTIAPNSSARSVPSSAATRRAVSRGRRAGHRRSRSASGVPPTDPRTRRRRAAR